MILTVTLNPTVDKSYEVEKLVPGDVVRVQSLRKTAAGKGIQVAKVARLLGEPVTAAGFSGGHTGDYIESFLTKAGIEVQFVRVEEETRTCINIHDASTGRVTELLEPGAPVGEEKQNEFLAGFAALAQKASVVVLGGSVPAGISTGYYPKLIAAAKKAGRTVILDTSGPLLAEGVKACPNAIKPNRSELMELIGRELSGTDEIVAAAKELQKKGIENVMVSLGKDGAVFVTPDAVYHGTTPDIPIVNTVGCGDSMVAGFAVGLARKMPLEETVKLAMAVSTANALRPETGYFLQEDFARLLTMVGAVRIS